MVPSAGLSEESLPPTFPFPAPVDVPGKEERAMFFSFQSDCVSLAPETRA